MKDAAVQPRRGQHVERHQRRLHDAQQPEVVLEQAVFAELIDVLMKRRDENF